MHEKWKNKCPEERKKETLQEDWIGGQAKTFNVKFILTQH